MHECSVTQSCPILWDTMDCTPPGSSIHGISQARILKYSGILEWVSISFCSGSSLPMDQICVSSISFTGRQIPYHHQGSPIYTNQFSSVQFSSVAQSCLTLCDPMNYSTPGLPVHHQLLEFTQTHVHQVGDAVHPSHPLSSPSPPAPNPSQHQGLFQ